jgi:hypothetical protein
MFFAICHLPSAISAAANRHQRSRHQHSRRQRSRRQRSVQQ